jgi:hypothetical protein
LPNEIEYMFKIAPSISFRPDYSIIRTPALLQYEGELRFLIGALSGKAINNNERLPADIDRLFSGCRSHQSLP